MRDGRTIPCRACKNQVLNTGRCLCNLDRLVDEGEVLLGCSYGEGECETLKLALRQEVDLDTREKLRSRIWVHKGGSDV